MRMDPETLLGLIIGLTVANGAVLYLCITGSEANAIPQYLKDLNSTLNGCGNTIICIFHAFQIPEKGQWHYNI
jgi:hypothetical protein